MFQVIRSAGSFATPLAILTVLLGVLVVRTSLRGRGRVGPSRAGLLDGTATILFLGFVAAALGFLGQCSALYRIMRTVVAASEISPDVIAERFAESFVTTLWGVGLLLFAGLAWLLLRGRRGSA